MSMFLDHPLFCAFSRCRSKRPWSLYLGFFVVLAILAAMLPFLFGRIVVIETFVRVRVITWFILNSLTFEQSQRKVYREILVAGDLSEKDVHRAEILVQDYFMYLDKPVSETAGFVYGNNTVYFAHPSLSQSVPVGSGVGTFNVPAKIGQRGTSNNTAVFTDRNRSKNNTGAILRYDCMPTGDVTGCPDIFLLATPSGESGVIARSCPILK